MKKFPSELRYDPVSQDWVLIATARGKRPEISKKEACPFENLGKKGEFVSVVSNKYPAFAKSNALKERIVGPYKAMDGVGFHEVIVTKDHARDIPEFSLREMRELIDAYQERYLDLMNEHFVNYISIFKNKGLGAGASIAHPHSQIIAAPLTNPDIQRSLAGSLKFWNANKKCVHCVMLEWDMRENKRIIFENDCFVALCPYASRIAFEIRIFPKKHLPYFERIEDHEKQCLSEAFIAVCKKFHKALKNPDYNYFLHTSPSDGENYTHYHWHWEILPKTSIWAGFEIGTGIEISTVEPEQAAELLRTQ